MQEKVGRPPGGQSTEKQRKAMKVAIERIKDWPPARRPTPLPPRPFSNNRILSKSDKTR